MAASGFGARWFARENGRRTEQADFKTRRGPFCVFFQDPQPLPETWTADVAGKANESFLQRLYEALFEEEPTGQGEAAQPRRLPPVP